MSSILVSGSPGTLSLPMNFSADGPPLRAILGPRTKGSCLPPQTLRPPRPLGMALGQDTLHRGNTVDAESGEYSRHHQAICRKDDALKNLLGAIEQRISDERSTAEYFNYKEATRPNKMQSDFAASVFADIDEVNRRYLGSFALFQMRREMGQSLFYRAQAHGMPRDIAQDQSEENFTNCAVQPFFFPFIFPFCNPTLTLPILIADRIYRPAREPKGLLGFLTLLDRRRQD